MIKLVKIRIQEIENKTESKQNPQLPLDVTNNQTKLQAKLG